MKKLFFRTISDEDRKLFDRLIDESIEFFKGKNIKIWQVYHLCKLLHEEFPKHWLDNGDEIFK